MKCFTINMDTAAGVSDDDGGGNRRRSSAAKGKAQVNPQPKPKKKGAWERAMLPYLQGKHEDAVAAGEEPPFGGRYSPPQVLGQTTPPPATNNNTPKDA